MHLFSCFVSFVLTSFSKSSSNPICINGLSQQDLFCDVNYKFNLLPWNSVKTFKNVSFNISFQYIFHSEKGNFEEITSKMKSMKFIESACDEFHSKILGDRLLGSTPYFYPFIVEFALIGASVAYIMSNHIGTRLIY